MNVDKFGHHINKKIKFNNIYINGCIKLDQRGNFDVENKKISNLQQPSENNDATTKLYVDTLMNHYSNKIMETLRKEFQMYVLNDISVKNE